MSTKKKVKTDVNLTILNEEERVKFRGLLDLMAHRFGGSPDSYLMLLGYKNYPNMFSLTSSKQMVDDPELILLEVELYKAYTKLDYKTKSAIDFPGWRNQNPIYKEFLARRLQAMKKEDETGKSPMDLFVDQIGVTDQAIHSQQAESSMDDELPPDTSRHTKHIESNLSSLKEALLEQQAVINQDMAYHKERMEHHEAEMKKMAKNERQIRRLVMTLNQAWDILREDE